MITFSLEQLQDVFGAYARSEFRDASAFLYADITEHLAEDRELLALAATVRDGQPPPNLLFAAVHYLLLSGVEHPLRAFYPDLTPEPAPSDEAFGPFRDFCLEHRDALTTIIQSRLVQTNVLERCGLLLPAFAHAAAALQTTEFAAIEIGASAGLNLLWDRYHYSYGAATWGDDTSPVSIPVDLRGEHPLPRIPKHLRATWRIGVDLDPVDLASDDAVLWQRALIWPERIDRQQRLQDARALMLADPVEIVAGDAVQHLPRILERAPAELPLIIFASYTLYQFPSEARREVMKMVAQHARRHSLALVTLNTRVYGDGHGVVDVTTYDGEARTTVDVARGHPHGTWIEWLS